MPDDDELDLEEDPKKLSDLSDEVDEGETDDEKKKVEEDDDEDNVKVSKAELEDLRRHRERTKSLEPFAELSDKDPLFAQRVTALLYGQQQQTQHREEVDPNKDNEEFYADPATKTRKLIAGEGSKVVAYINATENRRTIKDFMATAQRDEPEIFDLVKDDLEKVVKSLNPAVLANTPPEQFQQLVANEYDTLFARKVKPAYRRAVVKKQNRGSVQGRQAVGESGAGRGGRAASDVDALALEIGSAWGITADDLKDV